MRRLRTFVRLPYTRQRLLVVTLMLLWIVRIALWVLPFRLLRRYWRPTTSPRARPYTVRDIVWAVDLTTPLVPRATCLTRGLVAQHLLVRSGHDSALRIGVALSDGNKLESHAWVEAEGDVIIGNLSDLPRFKELPFHLS